MVTVDAVVLARTGRALEVALIERGHDPFVGTWALPGGFIEMDEPLLDAAKRELEEETGIRAKWLAPACFIGTPGRDPRGRTVSGVYYILLPERPEAKAGSDAASLEWFPVGKTPRMAFDHDEALRTTLTQVERDALTTALVFNALRVPFSERDFADACAAVPGLAWLESHARAVLVSLGGRGLVSEIDNPDEETTLFRFNRHTWGTAPRPWTSWFSALR